jgi:hypothetical protein
MTGYAIPPENRDDRETDPDYPLDDAARDDDPAKDDQLPAPDADSDD